MSKLNDRQIRFCEAYLSNGCANATKAAIDAGYSKKTAKTQGYQMLQRDVIKDYINERRTDITEQTNITVNQRLKMLWGIAGKGQELNPTGSYQNLSASIRAIEAINSMIGIQEGEEDDLKGSKVTIGVNDCSLPDEHYEDDDEEEY